MKLLCTSMLLGMFAITLHGQLNRVYFTDKGENLSLLAHPEKVLSSKALERRARHGIPLGVDDLPLEQRYVGALRQMGLSVKMTSRWFNYALVEGALPDEVKSLPFVKKVERPRPYRTHLAKATQKQTNYDYGFADQQIGMLNGKFLHQQGYTGKGVDIAVLDGGFSEADNLPIFDSLWMNGRILGTYSFVQKDSNVFRRGNHGTTVLSVMGGFIKDDFVGTAPEANFWLLTSEDEQSETPVEMDYWAAAAEFADSVGASVINSSLGYTTFDDSSDDFSYSDMDGNTTIVTRAADRAVAKGILVVVSAGNQGGSSWQYISAPADGDSVLAVGASDDSGNRVNFSSRGPSYDGRIKPDVAALGSGTVVADQDGGLQAAFGTSFSAPLIAGLGACLVQAQPQRTGYQLSEQIRTSSSQYFEPDSLLGYGIPDFQKAYFIATPEHEVQEVEMEVFPNPFTNGFNIRFDHLNQSRRVELLVSDMRSQPVYQSREVAISGDPIAVDVDLSSGVYILTVKSGDREWRRKIVK